jgi:hypothetical protein
MLKKVETMKTVSAAGYYCVSMATRGYFPSSLIPIKSAEEGDWQRYGKQMVSRDILQVVVREAQNDFFECFLCVLTINYKRRL